MNWKRWSAGIVTAASFVEAWRRLGLRPDDFDGAAPAAAVVLVGVVIGAVLLCRDLLGLAGKLIDHDSDRTVWHYLRLTNPPALGGTEGTSEHPRR